MAGFEDPEAVIFGLGAPNPDQTGARNWAGKEPNLLIVAVTRLRNRTLGRSAGVFGDLDTLIGGGRR